MADYNSLAAALNTTANMTAIRNNSPNDDSTDSVTGVSWFKFNNVVASTIYVSGNHWLGFGANAEHLQVCRRDGKCYYLYREEGTIKGTHNFLKIRWEGYTQYNWTTQDVALKFEVFLFSTGHIFLNVIQGPTNSSYLGTSALICNGTTIPLTITATTPMPLYYSFYAQNPEGTSWQAVQELMVVGTKTYAAEGSAVFQFSDPQRISDYASSQITWNATTPSGTSVRVYAALKTTTPAAGDYLECTNGAALPGITAHEDLTAKTLFIKGVLATTDTTKTPSLASLAFTMTDTKYNTFVPTEESGKYKVTCDIANRAHGITVMNKKTSRLRFATSEAVPVFSTHMFVAGTAIQLDAGYLYEKLICPGADEISAETFALAFWSADSVPFFEESTLPVLTLTTAENQTITLT